MAYQHELPQREAFAITRDCFLYHDRGNLRRIANEFDIRRKRRLFYDRAWDLAHDYGIEGIVEEDLLSVTEARKAFKRAIASGVRFIEDLEAIFGNRALYSLWNEPYFMAKGDIGEAAYAFRRDELAPQVATFVILTTIFLAQLPSPAPSRKKMLALRKWAKGHLDFWRYELGRPVTVIKDHRDGYSPCQSSSASFWGRSTMDRSRNSTPLSWNTKQNSRRKRDRHRSISPGILVASCSVLR